MYYDFLQKAGQLRAEHYAERKALVQEQVRLGISLVEEIRRIGLEDLRTEVRDRTGRVAALVDELSRGESALPREKVISAVASMAAVGESDANSLFSSFSRGMETIVFVSPAPAGLNAEDLISALKGVRHGERQVSLVGESGDVYKYFLVIEEAVAGSARIVVGACLELAEDVIKDRVVEELESIQFGEDGYLFGGTWEGLSIVGPAKGKSMWDVVDVDGVKIVQKLVAVSKQGGGLVSYVMPKINGQRHTEKISFAMPIPDWEWYIGAGQYVDDIEAVIDDNRQRLKQEILFQLGFIVLGLFLLSLVTYHVSKRLSRNMKSNVRAFTQVWNKASTKGALVDLSSLYYSEFKELATAANRMVEDRRAAEAQLADSVTQFKGLVSNLPGIVYQCSIKDNWTMHFISESVKDITGYSASEFLEHRRVFSSVIDSRDASWVKDAMMHDIESSQAYSLEYRIVRKDGSARWVLERGRARYDDEGVPQSLDGVILDVTERRNAEEEHYAHIHFLETMERIDRDVRRNDDLDTMLSEVMETVRKAFDADRCWLLHPCDPEAEKYQVFAERTVPEYPGAYAGGRAVDSSREVKDVFSAALESSGPMVFDPKSKMNIPSDTAGQFGVKSQMVVVLYPRVGQPWLMGLHQCSCDRVWNEDEVQLFKEASRRVSDALSNQLMHRELLEKEEKFRTFSEQTTLGICLVQDDLIKFANKAYCDIFEVSVEEMLSLPPRGFLRFVHPDDQPFLMDQARKKQAGDKDQVQSYSWRAITATGRIRWVEIHSKTVYMGGRTADLVSLLDITEIRRSKEELEHLIEERTANLENQAAELQEANARLIMLDDLKSSFLTTVSHKLKAPLASVLEYAESVRSDLETMSKDSDDEAVISSANSIVSHLQTMELEGERLSSLIDEFMVFMSIKAGTAVWDDQSLDLGEVIRQEVDKARFLLAGKHEVDIALDSVVDLPRISLDSGRIALVLRMLLDNSIRYSREGTIIVHAEAMDGHGVRFSVSDTGRGIPDVEKEAVFEPFYQVESEDASESELQGPGLGLALARSIVEHYGGSIRVESYLGKGSTFHVELPGTGVTVLF